MTNAKPSKLGPKTPMVKFSWPFKRRQHLESKHLGGNGPGVSEDVCASYEKMVDIPASYVIVYQRGMNPTHSASG